MDSGGIAVEGGWQDEAHCAEVEDLLKQWKLEEVQKRQHMVQRLGMLEDRMAMLLVPWCCRNVG